MLAPSEPIDFESALSNLLHKYNSLPENERPSKIQKVLSNNNNIVSREDLTELNDLFLSEGLQQSIGREVEEGKEREMDGSSSTQRDCLCPSCPHKMELERIELFYKDVFHL